MKKTCKIHGELSEQDIQIEKIKYKTKSGESRESSQYRCRICRRAKDMKYKHAHKDERLAYNKKWREENRDWVNQREREYRKNNPEKYAEWGKARRDRKGPLWSLEESLRLRNIDLDAYNKIFTDQNGVCGICKQPETRLSRTGNEVCRLTIDHCHKTSIVRGLLCHHCNVALGSFRDNIEILQSAITYLTSHQHTEQNYE